MRHTSSLLPSSMKRGVIFFWRPTNGPALDVGFVKTSDARLILRRRKNENIRKKKGDEEWSRTWGAKGQLLRTVISAWPVSKTPPPPSPFSFSTTKFEYKTPLPHPYPLNGYPISSTSLQLSIVYVQVSLKLFLLKEKLGQDEPVPSYTSKFTFDRGKGRMVKRKRRMGARYKETWEF